MIVLKLALVALAMGAAGPAEGPLPDSAEATLAEAQHMAESLVQAFPGNPDALEVLARLHFFRGHTVAAVAVWKQCLQANPQYAYAFAGLGMVASRRGEFREAAQWFGRAVQSAPGALAFREDYAEALINAGEVDKAIAVLEELVRASPHSARAFDLLGSAYCHLGKYAQARDNYQHAVMLDPAHAGIRLGLAKALVRLGQADEARKCMEEFRRLRAQEQARRQKDLREYDDLRAVRQDVARICTAAAQVYHAHGKPAEAERLWRRAAALDPTAVECRQALAWRYRQAGKLAETIGLLEELWALEPSKPSYGLEIARLHLQQERPEKAEAALQRLCHQFPRLAEAHALLAELRLQKAGQAAEALVAARRAAELEPSAAHYWLVARACQAAGNLPEALAALEKALALDPGNLQYREQYEELRAKR